MRLQLALNVRDLGTAVDFYTRMFGVAPAKVRPGYANFAIDEPPLKLVLFEEPDAPERLNHLGVEVRMSATLLRGTYAETLKGRPQCARRARGRPYGRCSQNDLTASSSISMCSVLTSSSDTSMSKRNKNATSVSCSRTVR